MMFFINGLDFWRKMGKTPERVRDASKIGADVIVRGLRITSDFEYESEMALMNRRMAEDIETICLFSALEYQILSSSRVKEVAALGADVSGLVPQNVWEPLSERIAQTKQDNAS